MKGRRVGDAEVSGVHGNFIINRGCASSHDVIHLVNEIRHEVKKNKGIELEPESLTRRQNVEGGLTMSANPKVVVLCGGISTERDISLVSGRSFAKALNQHFEVQLIEMQSKQLPAELNPENTVVFPAFHGEFGEDGEVQALPGRSGN